MNAARLVVPPVPHRLRRHPTLGQGNPLRLGQELDHG